MTVVHLGVEVFHKLQDVSIIYNIQDYDCDPGIEKFLLCICSTSCRSHRDDYCITDVHGVLELDGEEVCALRLLPSDASRGIGPPGVSPQFMSTHCVVVSMRETNVFECPTGLPMHLSQFGSINK